MPIKPISQLALESPPALTTVNGQKTCRAAHTILDILLHGYQRPVSVRLRNGGKRAGDAKARAILAFNDPAARNISRGGMFLETGPANLPKETLLQAKVVFPTPMVKSAVMWRRM